MLLSGCSDDPADSESRVHATREVQTTVVKQKDGGEMTTEAAAPEVPEQARFAKVFAFTMTVDEDSRVTLANPTVYYGKPPNNLGNPPMFVARLFNRLGEIKKTIPLWDPRWTFVWSDENSRDYIDIADKADVIVIVPYDPGLVALDIVKDVKQKDGLARVDVSNALAKFCEKNPKDPDCSVDTDQPTQQQLMTK